MQYNDITIKRKSNCIKFSIRSYLTEKGEYTFMKYEVFFLLQQYHKKYPERFHKVEFQDLKEKYTELRSEEVNSDVYTVNTAHCRGNCSGNVY